MSNEPTITPDITPRILRGLSFLADFLRYPHEYVDLEECAPLPRDLQKDLRHVVQWIDELEAWNCGDS